jgi:hypothetical protein
MSETEALAPLPPRILTPELSHAIDDVLLAYPMLYHSLAADHLPFTATLADAVKRYGAESPLLALWAMCRACEWLRVANG